jgi:L-rhamnose mutarotase
MRALLTCIITISILSVSLNCYSQNPFDEDIYQTAFRTEIISSNKVKTVFVIENLEGVIDTISSSFDKNGNEVTNQFFSRKDTASKIEYEKKHQFVYDSLERIIKIINPSNYNVKEILFEYQNRKVTMIYVYNDATRKNDIYSRFYNSNGNLIKETRHFSYGINFTFKYKYDNRNLLIQIKNADKTIHKVYYEFWE